MLEGGFIRVAGVSVDEFGAPGGTQFGSFLQDGRIGVLGEPVKVFEIVGDRRRISALVLDAQEAVDEEVVVQFVLKHVDLIVGAPTVESFEKALAGFLTGMGACHSVPLSRDG